MGKHIGAERVRKLSGEWKTSDFRKFLLLLPERGGFPIYSNAILPSPSILHTITEIAGMPHFDTNLCFGLPAFYFDSVHCLAFFSGSLPLLFFVPLPPLKFEGIMEIMVRGKGKVENAGANNSISLGVISGDFF